MEAGIHITRSLDRYLYEVFRKCLGLIFEEYVVKFRETVRITEANGNNTFRD